MDEAKIVGWLTEHPEFITTCAVCYIVWFLVARHIPFLMAREDRHRETSVGAIKEMTEAIRGLERSVQNAANGGPVKKRESRRLKRPQAPDSTGQ